MPRTLATIISAQIKKILKENNTFYTAVVDSDDVHNVYVMVRNLPDDYTNGEYLFRLRIPEEFPDKPPELYALTPNGLFDIGGQICISIGTFHRNDYGKDKSGGYGWRPAIGLSGFIMNGIINGLLHFDDDDKGIRIKLQPPKVKKQLANESVEYNKKYHINIIKLFNELKDSDIGKDLRVWG